MHWRERTMRRPAADEPGHAHAVTFTCYQRFAFLRAERTCQWFAAAIQEARQDLDFDLWAYVFMPEHVHLIVHPRQPIYRLSAILKAIKEPVGRQAVAYLRAAAPEWLPRITVQRGKRVEHRFWQAGGGYDQNVVDARALMALVEYLHQNPVRRGLVECPTEWKWSSAGWYAGLEPNTLRPDAIPPDWGLVLCGG